MLCDENSVVYDIKNVTNLLFGGNFLLILGLKLVYIRFHPYIIRDNICQLGTRIRDYEHSITHFERLPKSGKICLFVSGFLLCFHIHLCSFFFQGMV